MKIIPILLILTLPGFFTCQAQNNKQMSENKNPLLCDPETGVCEIPGNANNSSTLASTSAGKPVKIIYFTDPICSSCWGIEPQLHKLKLEYGEVIGIEYRMGGLLPDWSYNSGGISKPSDVAHHWDEVSLHYDMPIDGDVWLEDPLPSSFPPSIAFKSAQLQDNQKALRFLRRIREMVFLEKKNITKWEHIADAATAVGLDAQQLQKDMEDKGKKAFEADLALARQMGVRGFPSMFFTDSTGKQEFVYGVKPYKVYETAIQKLAASAKPFAYNKDWQHLFNHFNTLTKKEFAELMNISAAESNTLLQKLTSEGLLVETSTKNGSLWRVK
ncbi:Predicted dithiol-disulfide isomerase, DsbA family [Chitinophaga terrae (ex Kim and Jung 2007)]|jgi:predicted DsbA family dithiol-disulfide isomerase|uniref:Predicted dithiol-disulfide isomerase, DsbA family n=2 Tax=Chitinophaga terrae (ex Kim and Jung 2007) TaxID=408074 RepID=A0A1H4BZF0_9BACT|nr:Predicted dithiol-disulfide isomerase, DsbA family [Chitinophaga terrae (ex Kim and Jung 2007)]